jgi:PadR family transcriptional regulator
LLYRVSRVTRTRRPSAQTVAVLRALAVEPDRWRYGYDLCTELDLLAGSMYPILIRLADRGLLETGWETEHVPGRPLRHLYRLTTAGREFVAAMAPDPTTRTRLTSGAKRRTEPRFGGA